MEGEVVSESVVIAFLDGPDDISIPNKIHSTDGAKKLGYQGPLVGGVSVYSWTVPAIMKVFKSL